MELVDARALVVGIVQYQHVAVLPATHDAEDVAAVLVDPACCGYPPAAVTTLIDAAATRAAILEALDALARTTTAASTVFVYFSGHGARAIEGDTTYYLVPVDATNGSRAELERTAISGDEMVARLHAIPAGRLTLVLDCCRAAPLGDARLDGGDVAPLGQGRGRVVLAASRAAGAALVLPGERNSLLTGFLLEGLRGAATGVHGVIRICDLFQYVQERVVAVPGGQHPVFKAELEENYPIAQLHGGAAAAFELPAPPDVVTYDAYVSYCRDDADDTAWVTATLVPYLEQLGLVLCLEDRDFDLGGNRIEQIDHAVEHSRFTITVLTPAYQAGDYEEHEARLAAHLTVKSHTPRQIPLVRKPCQLALHTTMTELLDVTRDAEVPAALDRLALMLRQPPRPRLDG